MPSARPLPHQLSPVSRETSSAITIIIIIIIINIIINIIIIIAVTLGAPVNDYVLVNQYGGLLTIIIIVIMMISIIIIAIIIIIVIDLPLSLIAMATHRSQGSASASRSRGASQPASGPTSFTVVSFNSGLDETMMSGRKAPRRFEHFERVCAAVVELSECDISFGCEVSGFRRGSDRECVYLEDGVCVSDVDNYICITPLRI